VILPGSGKTDVDRRVWLLRVHDYGLSRLHIHELVFDLLGRQQAKFLRFFRGNLYYTAEITEITKTNRPQIPQILLRGRTTDCANITNGKALFLAKIDEKSRGGRFTAVHSKCERRIPTVHRQMD
jgi:hypothetical protein